MVCVSAFVCVRVIASSDSEMQMQIQDTLCHSDIATKFSNQT